MSDYSDLIDMNLTDDRQDERRKNFIETFNKK